LRREREKQAKIIQPRFCPGLIPKPRQRGAYERECIAIKNHFYQHSLLLEPAPLDSHQGPTDSVVLPQESTILISRDEEIIHPPIIMEHIRIHRTIISSHMPISQSSHRDLG
jgi:hypothetical protein